MTDKETIELLETKIKEFCKDSCELNPQRCAIKGCPLYSVGSNQ